MVDEGPPGTNRAESGAITPHGCPFEGFDEWHNDRPCRFSPFGER